MTDRREREDCKLGFGPLAASVHTVGGNVGCRREDCVLVGVLLHLFSFGPAIALAPVHPRRTRDISLPAAFVLGHVLSWVGGDGKRKDTRMRTFRLAIGDLQSYRPPTPHADMYENDWAFNALATPDDPSTWVAHQEERTRSTGEF